MDCLLSGLNIRVFACAVGTLSNVGKDIYFDFDAIKGLTIRTLNDAKSAYASFTFNPSFFERCAEPTPPPQTPTNSVNQTSQRRNRIIQNTESSDSEEENSENDSFRCRALLKTVHSILRMRKGLVSLRIRNSGETAPKKNLSFEFLIASNGNVLRVTRSIGVSDCHSVVAIAPRENHSEMVCDPKVLLKLLSPLKKTAEVALCIDDERRIITASSFHHGLTDCDLKTETSMLLDELEEFQWQGGKSNDDAPPHANSSIVLVFGIREVKAMLQFGTQSQAQGCVDENTVTVYFEWGGRPIIMAIGDASYSAELVIATLDHKLLAGLGLNSSTNT